MRRWALFVVAAGGGCLLPGVRVCAQANAHAAVTAKQADAAFRAGYEAANAGDLQKARQSFEEVVRLEPKIPEGHAALGSVLLTLGQPEQAAAELKRGLALKPDDPDMEMNLGLAEVRTGHSAEALPLFQKVLTRKQAFPAEVEIAYAQALTDGGQRSAAVERMRAAVASAPENAALHDALGSLLAQEQQWPGAQVEFARAVELDPQMTQARLHLGTVLMRLGQAPAAVETLEAAHAEQLHDVAVLNELALAYSAQGSYDKALPLAQEAMRLAPENPAAVYQAALALQGLGRETEALPLFEHVVAAEPKNAEALTNYALALVQQGKAKDAVPLYKRAAELTPNNPVVHEDFGVAYLQQSDIDDAIREFQKGLKLDNDSQQLHYNLGLAYKLKDDTARAVPELEQAARLDPSSPDPAYTLGILYMQTGRFADAEAQLRHMLELRPQNGDAWAVLGSVYKQDNKLPEAADALRHAIALLPNQPGPHITLASVLSDQGQKAEAATERKRAADLTRVAVNRQRATFATNTGNMLLAKGQVADAIERYNEAVASDPSYAEAHTGLATALERQGRTAEATAEREKAAVLAKPAQ